MTGLCGSNCRSCYKWLCGELEYRYAISSFDSYLMCSGGNELKIYTGAHKGISHPSTPLPLGVRTGELEKDPARRAKELLHIEIEKNEIWIGYQGHVSGLWLTNSFETGKRASHQECFGYPQIPDVESQSLRNIWLIRSLRVLKPEQHATSSSRTTSRTRGVLLVLCAVSYASFFCRNVSSSPKGF